MTTTISLQDITKAQLDEVLADEGHTSQDSAVKSLLLYRELYLQSQDGTSAPTHTPSRTRSTTQPPSQHAKNNHSAYIGKLGSGKTFTSKYHIHYQLEDDSDHDVIVIDPIGSYGEFTTRHGGTNITPETVIGDPFTFETAKSVGPNDMVTWGKKAGVPFVLQVLADRGYDATAEDEALLKERVEDAHERDGTVTLSDVANVNGPELPAAPGRDIDQALVDAIADDDCQALNVGFSPGFPADDLVTITPDRVAATDMSPLMGATLVAFSAAAQREATVDLYIDNSHYLMASDNHREIMSFLLRMGRHYGVYLNFISQTIEEFLVEDEEATIALFGLIETVFMHRMDDISEETRTKIGLTGAQAAYIENARVGNVNDHSEILVSADGSWSPRRVEVSEDLQKLIDPDES
jgi:hypothetical protein